MRPFGVSLTAPFVVVTRASPSIRLIISDTAGRLICRRSAMRAWITSTASSWSSKMVSQYSSKAGWYSPPGMAASLPAPRSGEIPVRRLFTSARRQPEHGQGEGDQAVAQVPVDRAEVEEQPDREHTLEHLEDDLGVRRWPDLAPGDGAIDDALRFAHAAGEEPLPHGQRQFGVADRK